VLQGSAAGAGAKLMQLGDAQITMQAHDRIVEHVIGRYDLAHRMRTTYIDVFKYIDNEYHTWMQRDKDDAKRQPVFAVARAVTVWLPLRPDPLKRTAL
jgi:hypothetical protein